MNDSAGFNDPKLKAAVSRMWSGESAPSGLRDRIIRDLSGGRSGVYRLPETTVMPPRRAYMRWLAMAAAAVLLLGTLGIGRVLLFPPPSPATASSSHLDQPVITALLATHDHCAASPDHHYIKDIPAPDDFPAIASHLESRLKQPVLVTSLPEGWTFRGAAVCPVGSCKSAHLVFSQNNKFISLFSLPASEGKSVKGDVECQSNGHCIAGFARADGLYCIVGSSTDGSLQPAEVSALRDLVRSKATAPPSSQVATAPPAELPASPVLTVSFNTGH